MLSVLLGAVELRAQDAEVRGPNQFAPGVLTTIKPSIERGDTISRHPIVELRSNKQLAREPKTTSKSQTLYEMAKEPRFRHDIWALELAMKPLRMMHVDIPQPSGRAQRKLIWYLVYRVRNTGAGLSSVEQEDGDFMTIEKSVDSLRFIPQFVLVSQDRDAQGNRVRKAYLDRILPAAYEAIRRRELPRGELLSSVQMAEQKVLLEKGRSIDGLWGVAIWEDVDPEIDFFSVFVGGLTNAYHWNDPPGEHQLGDPLGHGRQITRKTLQLNFWRPGDEYAENEQEIRFGVPHGKANRYGVDEGVAYRWLYR